MSQEPRKEERRSIWKIGAIGCLGFLVIVGLAVGWGSYEAYHMYQGAQELAKGTKGAGEAARAFLNALEKDPKQAASMMASGQTPPTLTPEQSSLREGKRAARYNVKFLSSGRVEAKNVIEGIRDWRFTYQYLEQGKVTQGASVLRLILEIHKTPERFEITRAVWETTKVEIKEEAPARAVLQFQMILSKGGASGAYLLTSPEFQETTTIKEFEAFVAKQGPAFSLGEAEVQSLEYVDDDNARVVATLRGPSSTSAIFEYQVSRQLQFAWLVSGMRAVVSTAPK